MVRTRADLPTADGSNAPTDLRLVTAGNTFSSIYCDFSMYSEAIFLVYCRLLLDYYLVSGLYIHE